FPKTRENELSVSADHLSIRRVGRLPLLRHIGDPVSLNDNQRVRERRSAVSIDQRPAFNHERRLLLGLGAADWKSPHDQSNAQNDCEANWFIHGCLSCP